MRRCGAAPRVRAAPHSRELVSQQPPLLQQAAEQLTDAAEQAAEEVAYTTEKANEKSHGPAPF